MRRHPDLTNDAFRAALDDYATAPLADLDGMMTLGRRAASFSWADDVLASWLDAQPVTAQSVDVANGVVAGFGVAGKAEPPRVVVAVIERAQTLGAAGLGHAANNVAFVAARALGDPAHTPDVRRAAKDLLEHLLAHADSQSLQYVARAAAQDALARYPQP